MSTSGSTFGVHDIHYFNGGLFADDEVFDLDWRDLGVLNAAAALDWSQVEPAIFGTLFERSLDPNKRSQLGQHYTSSEDILLVVEPVVIEPLQRRWAYVREGATALAGAAEVAKGHVHAKLRNELQEKVVGWMGELSAVRVLDPACGSGNFLYLALRRMLDLWHEARLFAAEHGLPTFIDKQVHPKQLFGLEINIYAQELASVVVWIGYLQWLNEHAIGWPVEPILRKLDNIQHRDAILTHNPKGKPVEPEWPEADFVVGNPPFLGGKRLRKELGDRYVDDLFAVYDGRVARESDLVVYWFEKARALVEEEKVKRAGLLATQGIRGGANRRVLEKIKESGSIFWAYSDRDWILEGAAVHVSMVGFDSGVEKTRVLNGAVVSEINADLTTSTDFTSAATLPENHGLAFMGDTKGGSFDVPQSVAELFLSSPLNANGRPNSDVVKPWINGLDLAGRSRNMYIIDFESAKSEQDAALYEAPYEHAKRVVLTERQKSRTTIDEWWRHERPRPELRKALSALPRYIVTPRVSRHRLFVFVGSAVIPDSALIAIARDDEYFLGVLHSKLHELWARRKGTQVREVESGFRYTPTSTFETFPFPWPPGHEAQDSAMVRGIAAAAGELVSKRDDRLNPPDASQEELKKRTLTNLYNARPAWLADVHRKLDEAVFTAYGWPASLSDAELLGRLLTLNHERAAT